jgi:hypothetical protein
LKDADNIEKGGDKIIDKLPPTTTNTSAIQATSIIGQKKLSKDALAEHNKQMKN